jgi:hypothetical protein
MPAHVELKEVLAIEDRVSCIAALWTAACLLAALSALLA